MEAFSPLARGKRMDDPRLKDIASRKQRSPAQIMLRWSIEKGLVAIPKAAKKERIEENGRIFDFRLSAEDVAMLDALDEGYRTPVGSRAAFPNPAAAGGRLSSPLCPMQRPSHLPPPREEGETGQHRQEGEEDQ